MLLDPHAPTLGIVALGARPAHLEEISPREMLCAQLASLDGGWVDETLPDDYDEEAEKEAARKAMLAMSAQDDQAASEQRAKNALQSLQSPQSIQHVQALLSAQDWDFVAKANEIRGFVVARILQHVSNPDPRVSLKASELAGKITEVALFTERVDVTASRLSDSDLDKKITERLRKVAVFTEKEIVEDVEVQLVEKRDEA